ncbi:MAG: ribosome maturation factor RimM [Trueperaceae bacterium]
MPEHPAPAKGPQPAAPPTGWVRLARLGRPFQVRGSLKAEPVSPSAATALRALAQELGPVWVDGVGATRLREARTVGAGLVLAVQGIYDRERARALIHARVWADPAWIEEPDPDDDPDAVDVARLEGASVRLDGAPYGRVAYVLLGAQDLLAIDGPDGERLVPWAAPYVEWDGNAVDLVDVPPGLLDGDGRS